VAGTAQLAALAEIDARTIDLHPGLIEAARVGVDLCPEGGDGEGMDDIVRRHDEFHDFALRDDDPFIDRQQFGAVGIGAEPVACLHLVLVLQHVRHDFEPAVVWILVGPVPLVADDLDGEVGRRRRILVAQQAD